MSDFFSAEHFKLLNKWQGQSRDDSNPEQNRAYAELKRAYEYTEAWALALQKQVFPDGFVSIRKRPTSQANRFQWYTWAKIYPRKNAPPKLAYTVGLEAADGFMVKIDTVGLSEIDPIRQAYVRLRDDLAASRAIVAVLPIEEGLTKDLAGLVTWSAEAISRFGLTYEEAVKKLGLQSRAVENSGAGSQPAEDADEEELSLAVNGDRPRNIIYYGPPGTGKTYTVQRVLAAQYTQAPRSVPSGEWKQQAVAEKMVQITWWEAIVAALYDLGGKGKVNDLLSHPFIQTRVTAMGREQHVRQTMWASLSEHAVNESQTVKTKVRLAPAVFDKSPDSIWELAGDWKEECSELIEFVDRLKAGPGAETPAIERFCFVTFHQSYGYEEFVEGLRPVLNAENQGLSYEIRKGAFRGLCELARTDPAHRYAMVIDEINRGNISKIFGELITLIELDKRDPLNGSKPPVEVKLAYSGDPFSVPANVDIIGTMNTADRSLALVDTALRRRFEFKPCWPDTNDGEGGPLRNLRVSKNGVEIDVRRMLERMNQRIEALYDRDHTIGHAYFTPLWDLADEERFESFVGIFRDRILPLLEEYFFDDRQKIRLVLADHQKPEDAQFITIGKNPEGELGKLFGNNHGLDTFAAKPRFSLNAQAFGNPNAYLGIYS